MYKRAVKIIATALLCGMGAIQLGASASAANSGNINFSAELLPSTTVTIPTNPVGVNITPSSAGAFGSTSFNVVVSTNQPGYTLSMTTSSTSLASTTINPETNDYFTIPTLDFASGGYTESTFTRNRWGISIDGGNYNAITASQQLKDTDTATNADATTIGIGANLDLLTASGSYSTTIEFTVVPKITMSAIQDITTATCPTSPILVYDNRDGTEYHIQKLIDGECWMLDNLALDLTNSTVLNKLSSSNTNATAEALTSLKNGNRSAGNQYATAGVANWTSENSYSVPLVNMTSKNVVPSNAPINGAGYNKVGGYYNFCAATAGSYCYGNGNSYSGGGAPDGNATSDICPAGWQMSSASNYPGHLGEYGGFIGSTDNTAEIAAFRTEMSLPLSGYFYDGSVEGQGSYGEFWTKAGFGGKAARYVDLSIDNIVVYEFNNRNMGYSVRCLINDYY